MSKTDPTTQSVPAKAPGELPPHDWSTASPRSADGFAHWRVTYDDESGGHLLRIGDGGGRFNLAGTAAAEMLRLAAALKGRSALLWSKEWPTEPGRYWFYGHMSNLSVRHGAKPQLMTVEAGHGPGPIVFVARGAFLYRSEGAQGLWLPLVEPELPDWSGK